MAQRRNGFLVQNFQDSSPRHRWRHPPSLHFSGKQCMCTTPLECNTRRPRRLNNLRTNINSTKRRYEWSIVRRKEGGTIVRQLILSAISSDSASSAYTQDPTQVTDSTKYLLHNPSPGNQLNTDATKTKSNVDGNWPLHGSHLFHQTLEKNPSVGTPITYLSTSFTSRALYTSSKLFESSRGELNLAIAALTIKIATRKLQFISRRRRMHVSRELDHISQINNLPCRGDIILLLHFNLITSCF